MEKYPSKEDGNNMTDPSTAISLDGTKEIPKGHNHSINKYESYKRIK